jgi:hypothetical protein
VSKPRLVAVPPPAPHKCNKYPLWTYSQGYLATCLEHYGTPLHAHPSAVHR